MRRAWAHAAVFVSTALILCLASCRGDPTLSAELNSLGPEDPNIPPGEYHRAGQPCTHCHNNVGTAKPEFSVAGTVFADKEKGIGVPGVQVRIIGADNVPVTVTTNCVGNFFLGRTTSVSIEGQNYEAYDPEFPLKVGLSTKNFPDKNMGSTLIHRDGSCAGCHRDPAGLDSVGHVYVTEEPANGPPPDKTCPAPYEIPIPVRSN